MRRTHVSSPALKNSGNLRNSPATRLGDNFFWLRAITILRQIRRHTVDGAGRNRKPQAGGFVGAGKFRQIALSQVRNSLACFEEYRHELIHSIFTAARQRSHRLWARAVTSVR